jgi:hypothetical protein
MRTLIKLALAGAVGLTLAACVYTPGPAGYGYYGPAYPAYYGPAVSVGYGGYWRGGWR